MDNQNTIFYRDWLPLPKNQFRILLHLARFGSFNGNLTDLCRYFSLSPQTKNRNKLRESIETLAESEMIEYSKLGNTWNLKLIPKEKEMILPSDWVDAFTGKPYSYSVSAENLIKVLLWIADYGDGLFTNRKIAKDLNISVSTIGLAKNVLKQDFDAIHHEIISTKIAEGQFRRIGQVANLAAWLKSD